MTYNYWLEAVSESFDEHGITATAEQMLAVSKDMEDARDSIGQAFYQPEDPRDGELEKLKKALQIERDKVHCRECNGRGEIVTPCGTSHVAISSCDRCRGMGRHTP